MKFFRFSSLRVRLIALLFVAIIPAFGFLWYSSIRLKQTATEDAGNRALHFAKVVAGNQEKIIEVTHQILHVFSRLPIVRSKDIDQCRQLFAELLQEYPYYSEFVLAAPNGDVLTGSKPLDHTVNASDKAWFKRTMKSGDFSFGEFQTGRISKEQILVMGFPVRDESGKILGAVAAGLDLDWLSNSLLSVDVPDYIHVEIINSEGIILAHYPGDKDFIGKKISDVSHLQNMFMQTSGTLRGIEHGSQYLFGYQLLRPLDSETIVRIGIPLDIALSEANNMWYQGLIWLGISSILAILVSWLGGSYFVVDKVNRLLHTTNEVAKGNLNARTGVESGSDELSGLASNFDRMTETLQAHEAELREREESFRALVEHTPDIITRFSSELDCMYVNPAAEKITGIPREQFIGQRTENLSFPNALRDLWRTKMQKVIETGREQKFEFTYHSSRGERAFYSRFVPEFGPNGEIQSLLGVSRDITALKETREELRKKEQEFRTLVENYPDAIGRFDRELKHLYVNPSIIEITGRPADFYIGKRHRDIPDIPEDFLEKWESNLQKVFDSGDMAEFEYSYPAQSGNRIFYARIMPEFYDEDDVQTALAIVQDITEQREAEEELKEREQEFRALVESSPDLIIRLDKNLINIYTNPAVEKFFNLSPEDFIGTRMKNVAEQKLQASDETVHNWEANLRKTIETGHEHKFESHYGSDEDIRYFYTFVVPEIIENGEVQTILAVTREITPLKRAQEQARSTENLLEGIFASLDEAVFLVNSEDRTIITCNKTTEKIFGYTPEELQGENTKILHVDQEMYEEFDEKTVPILDSEGTVHTEFQMRRKDGSVFPTEHTVTILEEESGEWSGVVSVIRDITERKRTERELKTSRQRLQSLTRHLQSIQEEERQNIARDIHDELGQMLTALQMDAIWLQRKLPEDMPEMYKKTESMYDLVDQSIETIQRISTDLRPSMLDDLGIEAVIQWEADKLEDRSEIECNIEIKNNDYTLDEDISIALYRVLQEALTNVLRHAKATKVDISYMIAEDKVILVIKDNGIGISKEAVQSSHSFGLSGMRERVAAWDGTFEVYGEDGKGTTVRAIIPLT